MKKVTPSWGQYFLFFCILILPGCASQWEKIEKEQLFKGPGRAYTVVLPTGWNRAPTTDSDHLVLSKDGLSLNQISIYRFDSDKAFPDVPETRRFKSSDWDTTPLDTLASYQARQLRSDLKVRMEKDKPDEEGFLSAFAVIDSLPNPASVEQLEISSAVIDKRPSFRLDTTSLNSWGLRYRTASYGLFHEDDYWLIQYSAPELNEWNKNRPTFERFLNSLQLKKKCVLFCSD